MIRLQTHLPHDLHVAFKRHALLHDLTLQQLHQNCFDDFFIFRQQNLSNGSSVNYQRCRHGDPLVNIMVSDRVRLQLGIVVDQDHVFMRHVLLTALDWYAHSHRLL